jgi:hypothetical protein
MHPFKDRANQKWVLTAYSDSGYSVFLMGAVIFMEIKVTKASSFIKFRSRILCIK